LGVVSVTIGLEFGMCFSVGNRALRSRRIVGAEIPCLKCGIEERVPMVAGERGSKLIILREYNSGLIIVVEPE
jgi:hypothetical protein